MGGFTLPSKTIREMIADLDRRHRPGRAPARRLAPHHPHHRGDRHRRRRHHHPGHLPLRDRGEDANGRIIGRHRSTGIGRPRSGSAPATSTRRTGSPPRSTPPTPKRPRRAGRRVDVRFARRRCSPSSGSPCSAPAASPMRLLYGRIQSENRGEQRLDHVQGAERDGRADPARRRAADDAAKRRKSVQETLKELEEKQKAKAKSATRRRSALRIAAGRPDAGRAAPSSSSASICGLVAVRDRPGSSARRSMSAAGLRRRRPARPAALDRQLPAQAPDQASSSTNSQRHRRHRARRQGRPAAQRLPQDHRQRSGRAGAQRVPHIIETQALGLSLAEAVARLPERVPVPEANFFAIVIAIQQQGRRQSLRGARQPLARPARAQEDEGQDQGDEHGGEGLRRDHRRAAGRRHDARLPDQPALHRAALHRAARQHHPRLPRPSGW